MMSETGPREALRRAGEWPRTATLFPADTRQAVASPGRGAPRTAAEWTGLVKVASGEHDIGAPLLHRLVSLGLLESRSGIPVLTRHGRYTLGLSD
jgi:hypothetical protein